MDADVPILAVFDVVVEKNQQVSFGLQIRVSDGLDRSSI